VVVRCSSCLVGGGVERVSSTGWKLEICRIMDVTTRCCGNGGVGDKSGCPKLTSSVGSVRQYEQKSSLSWVGADGDGACGRRFPPWRRY
jgi:hypothetical protein